MKKPKKAEKNVAKTGWDIWSNNFYNARRFFKSKGNVKTRSRLKDKWYKELENNINSVIYSLLLSEKKRWVREIEKSRGNNYHNIGVGSLDYHEKCAVDAYIETLKHRIAHLKEK